MISSVLLYAETDDSVPPPSSKFSRTAPVNRSRSSMPVWSTWIGLVTSLAFGGVVKVLNGFASSSRGITK